ncbi:UDP-N-acetylmuramate dehydrogenase [Bartonella sp. TP]|uniref:UDP-N-acetylmuramate dehydrogenase n=1 Tax=Bartonella sp. TP TaxID=3057550 RepID=UPI0025B0C2E2|nr:UDP-N-acetylmuramate dehydrogenase [Bartonella sp. TP]WJW79765.1 UDP-N-acetylmuramate dehydrogenase [Bartonella sp. TP]
MQAELKKKLAALRGKLIFEADMAKIVWFRSGGKAKLLFQPEDEADLISFLHIWPKNEPLRTIGIGSNLLVRDGGFAGAIIKLGAKAFGQVKQLSPTLLSAQCGVSDKQLSLIACQSGIGGFHFYSGIPGNLGGAIAMNAGANDIETAQRVVNVRAVDRFGNIQLLTNKELEFSYRHCGVKHRFIFLNAELEGYPSSAEEIKQKIESVIKHRESAQPVREKTGGSTFKNLAMKSAWQLIDEANCRGLRFGGAAMSEMHCNFMINENQASAYDLEMLGEIVRQKVYEHSGKKLTWEIERFGSFELNKIVESFD